MKLACRAHSFRHGQRGAMPTLVLLFCGNAVTWWWAQGEGQHEPLFLGPLLAHAFG